MRFESQFSRMNCQMFSTGFSSGHLDGSATRVMFGGTTRRCERCHPAWSRRSTAWAPGATALCDLGKVQVHGLGVAGGHDQGRALALSWTDRAEDVGRGGTLIVGRRRPGAAPRPAPGDLVLLADPRFVGEPELYPAWLDALLPRDLVKTPREAFLKSSIAPSA